MSWAAESGWLNVAFEYLIKSTVVLTLALILVILLRKWSASLRHFVLSLSLAGLLLLPVLPYLGLGWETNLLPAKTGLASANLAVPFAAAHGDHIAGAREQENVSLLSIGSAIMPDQPAHLELAQDKAVRSSLFFIAALPFIWLVGLAVVLLRLAAGIYGAFRLTREGETVRDPRWRVLLERFLAVLHLRRKVRLKSHPQVLVPLTWGFLKPVVLIPEGNEDWTEEQRSTALIHELWHVKRADFLVMVLVRLSLAVFWFNPLSWVVFRKLKNQQEEACDELVLRTGIKPSIYAANLLSFKTAAGSWLGHFAALLGLFGFGKSSFNERLVAILRQEWIFQEVKMKTKIMLSCAVILVLALIGMARPSTPAGGDREAAVSPLVNAGPSVLEKTSGPENPASQAAEQSQEQSQPEEKKAQEKKQQEPAQKEPEQKAEKKKAVACTIKKGGKYEYQIKIQEGDKVKTIVIDEPVIIKKGKEGKVFIITPKDKEVKVLEGDPVHLEIIGDKLEFIKEGKVIKVGKDGCCFYVNVCPDVEVDTSVTSHVTWVSEDLEKEIREKLRGIREKLKEVEEKKLELREVDKALADLERELEKLSKETSRVAIRHMEKPHVLTIEPEKGHLEAGQETEPDIGVDISKHAHKNGIKVIVKEKGSFSLYCQIDPEEKGRAAYERIVARVTKALPEGFTLEPTFEEESGLIALKISGPTDKDTPKDLIKKLTDSIRDETKEKKD